MKLLEKKKILADEGVSERERRHVGRERERREQVKVMKKTAAEGIFLRGGGRN